MFPTNIIFFILLFMFPNKFFFKIAIHISEQISLRLLFKFSNNSLCISILII